MMKFTLTNELSDEFSSQLNDQNDLLNDDFLSQSAELHRQQIITVVPIEKDAPSSENWYHGRLDRLASEERLRQAQKPASFLLRESERKPGSFVLSYYSIKTNIYHFKITAVFGDYYIGGRRFDRLETLISYYMYYSELVKGEKLENPIAPFRVCKLERTYLSIKPYSNYQFNHLSVLSRNQIRINRNLSETNSKNNQSNYWNNSEDILYFDKIGERFKVFHEVGEGEWLWAQSCRTNEFGLLYAECVIQIDDFKLHEIESWYYTNITKEEAASILSDAGNFSYLVRPSDQTQGNFTLFFYVDNIVHRYRITSYQDEVENSKEFYTKYYSIGGRDFTSISSIVERYMSEEIAEGYRLTKVPQKRPEYYSQTMSAFLKSYLNYKNIDYVMEHSERLEKSCSFKIKSSTQLKAHESSLMGGTSLKRNSIVQSNQNLTNIQNSSVNNDYLNIPDVNSKKLSQSLNESAMNTALTSKLSSYKPENNNTTPKISSLTTSKSISSPLSSIILHNNNKTLANSSSFKDLRNYDLINQFDQSNNSKKIFCGNLSRTSISIKPIGTELMNKKTDKNILTGYLNKYNEKTKKWKPYWFLLKQTDQQLFYFSNEKRLKEKGLIDLSYGFYYPVDDSFFNKSNCFQIVIQTLGSSNSNHHSVNTQVSNNITHFLSADNPQMFKEWTENIRPLCNPIQFNPFVCQPFGTSSMSCLSLSSSSSSTSTASSGSSSTSSSLSSSSPLNTSESINNDQNNLKAIKNYLQHNQQHHNFDKNFRILRTLSVDIHEARNVCFSPLFQSRNSNESHVTSMLNANHSHNLPKYHKDNLYYCVVLFNHDAYVASTRHTTCNNFHSNTNNNLISSSLGFSLSNNNSSSSSSSSSSTSSHSNGFDILNTNGNKYSSKDSIWDDSFSFDNLPLDVKELKICLFCIAKPTNFSASFVNNLKKISSSNSTSKMLDPLLIGSVNIRLDELINRGLHETWYNVEPEVHVNSYLENKHNNPPKHNNNCTLRVKIRFCEEKIYLNKDHYKDLCAYLMDEKEHKHLCTIYEQIIPSTERSHLVHSLVRFFIVKNKIVEMLKSFLITEIDRCSDLSTLFRPATMSTSLMDHYMRTRCDEFLKKALEEPLTKILRQNQAINSVNNGNNSFNSQTTLSPNPVNFTNIKSFELDPTKCKDANQREINLANFQSALTELISSICNQNSVGLFPNELKYLFYLVRQHVHLKWKQQQCNSNDSINNNTTDDKLVRIYCVSAFVFLRLLCPALLNPKNFGLKFFDNITNLLPNSSSSSNLDKSCFNNVLNYTDLANQFCVFSPAFMFSLSPNNNTKLSQSNDSNQSNVAPIFLAKNSTSSQKSLQIASVYERHIKLLAKVLQTLANMTECKEPFMLPLSDFLNVNKPNVIKFIEDISSLNELSSTHVIRINNQNNSNDNSSVNEVNIQFENASCKYLAILFRLLSSFVPQMKSYLDKSSSPSILNESVHNIDECLDDEQDRKNKEDESSFTTSLTKLINILNDINKKTK